MAVVLSRKGFDSKAGKMYLPLISRSGEYAFLHRPESEKTIDTNYKGVDYYSLPTNFPGFTTIGELLQSKNKLPEFGAHVDPDLVKVLPIDHWKPAFGQKGSAQGYLKKRDVGKNSKGTIFLFFSRFKPFRKTETVLTEGYYIYGWLEVKKTLLPSSLDMELAYHPHFSKKYRNMSNNIVYIASEHITDTSLPGAGMFNKLSKNLRLSFYKDEKLLTWRLPDVAFKGFSRLKNYEMMVNGFCKANWPATFGQEAVCSRVTAQNEKQIENVKKWAVNLIRTEFEKNGMKEKSL